MITFARILKTVKIKLLEDKAWLLGEGVVMVLGAGYLGNLWRLALLCFLSWVVAAWIFALKYYICTFPFCVLFCFLNFTVKGKRMIIWGSLEKKYQYYLLVFGFCFTNLWRKIKQTPKNLQTLFPKSFNLKFFLKLCSLHMKLNVCCLFSIRRYSWCWTTM